MMVTGIYKAFNLGKEYAKLEENLFWFGRMKSGYPVRDWERKVSEIEDRRKKLGYLERIAFEFGDDIFTLGSKLVLVEPHK